MRWDTARELVLMKGKMCGVVVMLALVLVGCAVVAGPCDQGPVEEFLRQWDAKIPEWDDQVALALKTSRISLSGPIEKLQQIKRDIAALETDCEQCVELRDRTGQYMSLIVDGFLAFMGDEDGYARYFDLADEIFPEVIRLRLAFNDEGEDH